MEDKLREMEEMLEKSKSTDIGVLLSAKEAAKRLTMDDPSAANLSAYKQASQMLEAVMEKSNSLKGWQAVLAHVEESGRKLKKTKLYEDIGKGRLKRQPDGTFKIRDVDRYAASLPTLSVTDKVRDDTVARQKRKETLENKKLEIGVSRDELKYQVELGKFISREQVYQELAGRAIALASGLKTAFESATLDMIHKVEGNPKRAQEFSQAVENILDEALNNYSQVEDFEVLFISPTEETGESSE